MPPLVPSGAAALAGAAAAWRLLRLGRDVRRARRLAAGAVAYQRRLPGDRPGLLVAGDSLSVGVGARLPEHSIAGRIAQACPGLEVRNVARSGARLEQVVGQLRAAERLRRASGRRWAAVLLVAGGNDAIGGTPQAAVRRAARRAVAAARRLAPRVVVATSANVGALPILPWPLTRLLEARSRAVRDALRDACARPGVDFVDFFVPLGADPFSGDPDRWFGADGVHPSSDCYELCFRTIERRTGLAAGLATIA
jgi:lysophospholipase L1-like esterase